MTAWDKTSMDKSSKILANVFVLWNCFRRSTSNLRCPQVRLSMRYCFWVADLVSTILLDGNEPRLPAKMDDWTPIEYLIYGSNLWLQVSTDYLRCMRTLAHIMSQSGGPLWKLYGFVLMSRMNIWYFFKYSIPYGFIFWVFHIMPNFEGITILHIHHIQHIVWCEMFKYIHSQFLIWLVVFKPFLIFHNIWDNPSHWL